MAILRGLRLGVVTGLIDVHQAIILALPRLEVFVAQAYVNGEVGADLPAIVDKIGLAGAPKLRDRRTARGQAQRIYVSEIEVRRSITGSLILSCRSPPYICISGLIKPIAANFGPELERVRPMRPRESVYSLEGLVVVVIRTLDIISERRIPVTDPYVGNSPGKRRYWIQES